MNCFGFISKRLHKLTILILLLEKIPQEGIMSNTFTWLSKLKVNTISSAVQQFIY